MFDFLKKKSAPEQTESEGEELDWGTQIQFDPKVVDKLKHDHGDILATLQELEVLFGKRDTKGLLDKLHSLRHHLEQHIASNNVRVLFYLEHNLDKSSEEYQMLRSLHRELDQESRTITAFLDKYEALNVDLSLMDSFELDLFEIAKVIQQRMEQEEQIVYPIYLQQQI